MEKRKIPPIIFYLLSILIFIFLLDKVGALRFFRTIAESAIITPVKQKLFDWQRMGKKDLNSCQLKEQSQISELKSKVAALEEENVSQKRLLSAPLPKNWQFLSVKVIAFENEVLTLNLGASDGVKEGMIAVSQDTYLGKVFLVSEKESLVRLPSYSEQRLLVRIIASNNSFVGKGLLIGRGVGQMKVEQVISSELVKKEDLVVTSAEGKDLVVGQVEEVIENKGEVFKVIQVKRLYNPEELNTIFLVRGKI